MIIFWGFHLGLTYSPLPGKKRATSKACCFWWYMWPKLSMLTVPKYLIPWLPLIVYSRHSLSGFQDWPDLLPPPGKTGATSKSWTSRAYFCCLHTSSCFHTTSSYNVACASCWLLCGLSLFFHHVYQRVRSLVCWSFACPPPLWQDYRTFLCPDSLHPPCF